MREQQKGLKGSPFNDLNFLVGYNTEQQISFEIGSTVLFFLLLR